MTNNINEETENSLLGLRNLKIQERWIPGDKQKQTEMNKKSTYFP